MKPSTHQPQRKAAASAPSELVVSLFAPGMSSIHRAGLGGLAATLRQLERQWAEGALSEEDLPGGPWKDGCPPWEIESQMIRLNFGEPDAAGEFFRRLFAFAFQVRNGLICLPGQYRRPPNVEVQAYLQLGCLLTFLQHGRTRALSKEEQVASYHPEGEEGVTITFSFRKCSAYKHQEGWRDLIDNKGRLTIKPIEVVGPMNPGAVVRHNAFTGQTKIEEDPARILALYFALVGCLALSVNRGTGVLLVPEVEDLQLFADLRPKMTPRTALECQITSAGDAALQAQIRVRTVEHLLGGELPGCHAFTFRPTVWATQQKSRVDGLEVLPGDATRLDQFATALDTLRPRVASRVVFESRGTGRNKEKVQRTEWFWADSVVRPLVAARRRDPSTLW